MPYNVLYSLFRLKNNQFHFDSYGITIKDGGGFETKDFNQAKLAGEFPMNMGRVPLLEIDNGKFSIGQSKTIERYIAAKCQLMGTNAEEAGMIGEFRYNNLLL